MPSIAQHHFPRVRWKKGERVLWNPIQRKTFKNRPEERVRLRIVDALMDAGWSRYRISTEESLRTKTNKKTTTGGRTDIICYSQDFEPVILVECKAESVPISYKVAEQTARYNREVEADYLLMTNGKADFWYQIIEQQRVERIRDMPELLEFPDERSRKEITYWQERGFAGERAEQNLKKWLESVLHFFWFEVEGDTRFLSFQSAPAGFELAHYYKIFTGEEDRIAIGFLNTPSGGSVLVGILNRGDENVGMIEVDLNRMISCERPDSTIHTESGSVEFGIEEHFPLADAVSDRNLLSELPRSLIQIFDRR